MLSGYQSKYNHKSSSIKKWEAVQVVLQPQNQYNKRQFRYRQLRYQQNQLCTLFLILVKFHALIFHKVYHSLVLRIENVIRGF